MRKLAAFFLVLASVWGLSSCGSTKRDAPPAAESGAPENRAGQTETVITTDISDNDKETDEMTTIQIIINGQEFEAELYDNEAARQFREMLPLQIDMEDLHNNEKYFYFSDDFATADQEIKEIHEGDLLIYDGSCLVLFYETFETRYEYSLLGKISHTAGLKEALGTGTASVSFQAGNNPGAARTSVNVHSFDFEILN